MKLKLLSAMACALLTTACGGGATTVATAEDLAADIAADPKMAVALDSFFDINVTDLDTGSLESEASDLNKSKRFLKRALYSTTSNSFSETNDCPVSGTSEYSATIEINNSTNSAEASIELTANNCKFSKNSFIEDGFDESEICFDEVTMNGGVTCDFTSSSNGDTVHCYTSSGCSGFVNVIDGESFTLGQDWTIVNDSGVRTSEGTVCINGTSYDINDILEYTESQLGCTQ